VVLEKKEKKKKMKKEEGQNEIGIDV
jgi:hypothetical protein